MTVKTTEVTSLAERPETAMVRKATPSFRREDLVYIDIVNYVRERLKTTDATVIAGKKAYQVDITGAGSGVFYIELADGFLAVEPYDYRDRDARIVISSGDLLDLVEGILRLDSALLAGRVYIEGDWDSALELKKLLEQI